MTKTTKKQRKVYAPDFTDHVHTEGYLNEVGEVVIDLPAPPCAACERENEAFMFLLSEMGDHYVEKRLSKSAAFRAYRQRYPYDFKETYASLDTMMDGGYEQEDMGISVEDAYKADESVREFRAEMTEAQRSMAEAYSLGFKTTEIYKSYGYEDTGGLRYHKLQMKRRLKQLRYEQASVDESI